ncbi:hypothetical protein BSKO_04390 [Bryopsis sp. KO-2023]|nr:hypothetical protein BSKO_04390 [Bryopsis sp. KO-2023]
MSAAQSALPAPALLQVLSEIASSKDVGSTVSDVCKRAFSGGTLPGPLLSLVFDLVHFGEIPQADWVHVVKVLKDAMVSTDPDTQSLGLNLIPSMPPEHLSEMLTKDDVGGILINLSNERSPIVRAAAITALGHLLTQSFIVERIAAAPGLASMSEEWWQAILDSMIDSDDEVVGAAFSAVARLLSLEDSSRKQPPSPAVAFLAKSHGMVLNLIAESLSPVLHRAGKLDAGAQIPVAAVLSGLAAWLATSQSSDLEEPSSHGFAFRWCVASIGSFLETLLSSIDSAAVVAGSRALLEVTEVCINFPLKLGGAPVPIGKWSSLSIASLMNLWEAPDALPGRGQLMKITTKHMGKLEMPTLSQTIKSLIPLVSTLPSASDRIEALSNIWVAALVMDSKTRKTRRSRGEVVQGATLQAILEDTFTASTISGANRAPQDSDLRKVIQRASYPAFRQELTCSLMQVLLDHATGLKLKTAFACTFESFASGSSDLGVKGAIRQDAQWTVLDWLAACVVAVHETQACLGWENSVTDGNYGMTLPSDLWLQVLQQASQCISVILRHFGMSSFIALKSFQESVTERHTTAVLKTVAGEIVEVQKLMKRMILYWAYLNDALKGRVLWIVSHHLELPSKSDETWLHLKDGLLDVLMIRPVELKRRELVEKTRAAAAGLMAPPYDAAYQSIPSEKTHGVACGLSEVADEGIIAGITCLGHLASVLDQQRSSPHFHGQLEGIKSIANVLQGVCSQFLESDHITVDIFEQCQGILKALKALAEEEPPGHDESEEEEEEEAPAEPTAPPPAVLEVELSKRVLEGFPFSGPKAHALFFSRQAQRNRALLHQLSKANRDIVGRAPPEDDGDRVAAPVSGQPSPVELAAAVGGLDLKGGAHNEGEGRTVTGPGDPVRLTLRHRVDSLNRMLTVELCAENQMGSDVTGVLVSLGIDGPVTSHRDGLVEWKPEKLQAQEPVLHQVHLSIVEFGSIELQPTMEVTLQGAESPPILTCSSYMVPMVDLLQAVDVVPTPTAFMQDIESWPAAMNCTGVCRWPGTTGGLQLLSVLDRPPLRRVWPQSFTSVGSFQAAYLTEAFGGHEIAISISGQLLELRYMGLAEYTLAGDGQEGTGFYLCRILFSSKSERVMSAIRAQLSHLLSGLTEGGVILGLDPGAGRPPPPPPIHPAVIPSQEGVEERDARNLESAVLAEWHRLNSR